MVAAPGEFRAEVVRIDLERMPAETRSIRPRAPLMARLMSLHENAGKLAKEIPTALANPVTASALEQELVYAMIACLTDGSASGGRSRSAHAKVIARFEAFLESRQYEPVYLAEICAAVGVSERTLRTCCQEHLGMGPIHYLWLRRMHLAHRALLRADPTSRTVTSIATEHGFWELGRFSVEYRALFGEAPSASLHRPPSDCGNAGAQRSPQNLKLAPMIGPCSTRLTALALPGFV